MRGVCSPGGHQEGGGPAGTQAILLLSAQDDGPHHPLDKAGQIKRVGRGGAVFHKLGKLSFSHQFSPKYNVNGTLDPAYLTVLSEQTQ